MIRHLRQGEGFPFWPPKRYDEPRGYVRLRWKIGPNEYVETYLHRLAAGLPPSAVHHKDGDPTNNDPSNLEPLSASDHCKTHNPITWDIDEAMSLYSIGWTAVKLSQRYGVHHVTILKAFRLRGVKMRTPKDYRTQADEGAIRRGCEAGLSVGQISVLANVGRGVVARVIRENGYPRQKPGRPKDAIRNARGQFLGGDNAIP